MASQSCACKEKMDQLTSWYKSYNSIKDKKSRYDRLYRYLTNTANMSPACDDITNEKLDELAPTVKMMELFENTDKEDCFIPKGNCKITLKPCRNFWNNLDSARNYLEDHIDSASNYLEDSQKYLKTPMYADKVKELNSLNEFINNPAVVNKQDVLPLGLNEFINNPAVMVNKQDVLQSYIEKNAKVDCSDLSIKQVAGVVGFMQLFPDHQQCIMNSIMNNPNLNKCKITLKKKE